MAPWARASELDRLLACPAAGHLTRIADTGGTNYAAAWGTAWHLWKETGDWPISENTRTQKAYDDRIHVLKKAGITRDQLWNPAGTHERAVAIGVVDGIPDLRELVVGTLEERDDWKLAHDERYCVGTCDYDCGLLDQWHVDDLKTGREVPDDPLELAQMRFYASYFALRHKVPVVCSLTHWPRSPATAPPVKKWSRRPWTVFQAEEFIEQLETARQAILRSAARKVPDSRPGEHCRWCRAQDNCPSY